MRRAIPQRAEFERWCSEKLRNADTDQFRHVNNAAMASLFEAGRMELFGDPTVAPLLAGAHPAVVRLAIDFHRELFYPGEVAIGTRVARGGSRSVEIAQGLFDAQGCVASAEATCVFLASDTPGATTISEELRHRLTATGEAA